MSHISKLFYAHRKAQGVSVKEIAVQAGYKNIVKGIRRYSKLEHEHSHFPDPRMVERFAPLLGITEDEIDEANAADFQILDQPVRPSLIIRLMAAVYVNHKLPENCTVEQAVEIAKGIAVEKKMNCCVTVSSVRGIYISPDGTANECLGLPVSIFNTPRLTGILRRRERGPKGGGA